MTLDEDLAKAKAIRTEAEITNVVVSVHLGERPIAHYGDVIKLIDRSRLIVDEDGVPANVRELLDEVLDRLPWLTEPESAESVAERYEREERARRAQRPMRPFPRQVRLPRTRDV